MPDQNWQFELEEYIKQGEPDRTEKSEAWQTAIGLAVIFRRGDGGCRIRLFVAKNRAR